MDGKKQVLEFLNLKTIGKREVKLYKNVGELAPLQVERINGDNGYVVGKYDANSCSYSIIYDPNCSNGVVSRILCSFKQIGESEKKDKEDGQGTKTKEG